MACSKGLGLWLLIMGTLLVDHQLSAATLFTSPFNIPSCPKATTIIKSIVGAAVLREPRMGASLLRLHFHDCFVNGCDGSVLLDDTLTFLGEKSAAPNANSARGFDVIDNIKAALELVCPRTVSCADILAIAARDSVVFLGGPSWNVNTGRQDAITASFLAANNDLPTPTMDVNALISNFANKGFTPNEMVALSGSHTIGQSRCVRFRDHIYNDTNIDGLFQLTRKFTCPTNRGDDNLAPLDWLSPNSFDNSYFRNLMSRKGLLHSDQELFNNGPVDSQVATYAANPSTFQQDFANAMVKMSNLQPSPGTITEIRTNCRRPNSG